MECHINNVIADSKFGNFVEMGETQSVTQQIIKGKNGDLRNETKDRIDIDKPLWSQDTYLGRWMHYAFITDCRTIVVPTSKLWEAKKLCEDYKAGKEPECLQRKDIIYAKKLRDSAFHPDNGELMHVIGRMSFQLPSSVVLTAAMLTFYRSAYGVIACQLVNQGFNAFVNYTNRNAMSDEPQDTDAIQQAFVLATVASCAAALGFRKLFSGRGTLFARFAPFCAVAAGNIVNLPIMRQRELTRGIPIFVKSEDKVCIMRSQVAAVKGISECVLTRIIMAAPGMLMIPIITQRMQPYCFYQLRPWIAFPIEIGLCALSLLIMIPSALAIFPQKNLEDFITISIKLKIKMFNIEQRNNLKIFCKNL
ncbi:sideroflexin-2-like isoform X2 [Nylanderia fulva]|uniref:sideroflexin-2-like isoform X2 n=1 Tax=Nylanderia fulva TaxID=613905 RepID=UPI0010FADFCB|nr:sideroflexin-2-like isoform X2 [Nylanderia fulva]